MEYNESMPDEHVAISLRDHLGPGEQKEVVVLVTPDEEGENFKLLPAKFDFELGFEQ